MISYWKKLRRLIQGNKKILVATHLDPDGDAISAALALNYFVQSLNRTPLLYCIDPVPEKYLFLPGANRFKSSYKPYDLLIIVDTAKLSRIGPGFKPRSDKIINIDHHKSNERFGILKIINSKASSTCEIIYEVLKASKFKIASQLAEILYTGIYSDTGGFIYANTTQAALKVAQELIAIGARPYYIARRLNTRSESALRLLGMVLNTLIVDRGIASIRLTKEMLNKAKAKVSDSENFVSLLLTIEAVKVAIFFREGEDGKLKISLRSDGSIDVDCVAAKFGGGGHKMAAGLRTSRQLSDIKKEIVKTIRAML